MSTCPVTDDEIRAICNHKGRTSILDVIPFVGPAIKQYVPDPVDSTKKRENQLSKKKEDFEDAVRKWRSDVSGSVYKESQAISELFDMIAGGDDDISDSYVGELINYINEPKNEQIGYLIVSVITLALAVFIIFFIGI